MTEIDLRSTWLCLRSDWKANPRTYKIRILLIALRVTQLLMGNLKRPRLISYPAVALYRCLSEWVFAIEIRPTTAIGPGLQIHHGFGLVVNPQTRIGAAVTLRNGVVIGNKSPGGPCPTIEQGVEFGANAVAIGGITLGRYARIGAGAVVLRDVPANTVVAGNPARVIGAQDNAAS